jgi:hypothetical protein
MTDGYLKQVIWRQLRNDELRMLFRGGSISVSEGIKSLGETAVAQNFVENFPVLRFEDPLKPFELDDGPLITPVDRGAKRRLRCNFLDYVERLARVAHQDSREVHAGYILSGLSRRISLRRP